MGGYAGNIDTPKGPQNTQFLPQHYLSESPK